MKQCTVDNEMCLLHNDNKELQAIMTKHVDDLTCMGTTRTIIRGRKQIEQVFGPLKIECRSFVNCGVKHEQNTTTKEIALDQAHYSRGIHAIPVTE